MHELVIAPLDGLWCDQFGEEMLEGFVDSAAEELGEELEENQGKRKKVESEDDLRKERKVAESEKDVIERWADTGFSGPERLILDKRDHGGGGGSLIVTIGTWLAAGVCVSCMGRRSAFASGTPVERVCVGLFRGRCSRTGRRGTPSWLASTTIV